MKFKETKNRDFPGGLVVKTSLSNEGSASLNPGRGLMLPPALQPKKEEEEEAML